MTTPRYLPVETFKQWNHDDIAVDDNLIESAINAAEELIDEYAGRGLEVVTGATSATARVVAPDVNTALLRIWDADEVSTVVENGTTLTVGTHYQLEPLNQISPTTGAYRPYDTIRRLSGCWYTNAGEATVTVTAKWGWAQASIPAAVVEACKVLTRDWLAHRTSSLGVVGANEGGFSIGAREWPQVRKAIATISGPKSAEVA